MGILRMDLGSRNLSGVDTKRGLNKISIYVYIFALGMAFVVPFSPFFISDLLILKMGMESSKYWTFLIPILNLIFFVVLLNKFLPLLELEKRDFLEESKKILTTRFKITLVMILLTTVLGFYGIFLLLTGGFSNV